MSSADIAACFPSEHDSLLGTDVESRRRSSKPFYLTRSSLETRKKEQGGLAGWWARFGEGGTIFDAFLMDRPTSTHGQGHELGLYIDYPRPRFGHGRLGVDQDDGREGQGVRVV